MRVIRKSDKLPIDFLQTIIASKKEDNKKRMNSLKPELVRRFKEYEEKATIGELHKIRQKWTYAKKESTTNGYFLYHQYDNSEASISKLRADLIEKNNGELYIECPICGIRETTDLDHYIPRQLFPEFSIHPYNLIPTCHECNNDKGVLWCDNVHKKRIIFNAYYDTPTDKELFNKSIAIEKNIPRIKLSLKTFAPPIDENTRIALSTIGALELMPVFNVEINNRFKNEVSRIRTCQKHWSGTFDDFWNFTVTTYQDLLSSISDVNDLNRILYGLISTNLTFLNWLKSNA